MLISSFASFFQFTDLMPYLGSLLAAALIFFLVRLSIKLRNSSELSIRIKRFLSMDQNELKFIALIARDGEGCALEVADLVAKKHGKTEKVAAVRLEPVIIGCNNAKMEYREGKACFRLGHNGKIEAVFEFTVPDSYRDCKLFLQIRHDRRKLNAPIPTSTSEEWVSLQRG